VKKKGKWEQLGASKGGFKKRGGRKNPSTILSKKKKGGEREGYCLGSNRLALGGRVRRGKKVTLSVEL